MKLHVSQMAPYCGIENLDLYIPPIDIILAKRGNFGLLELPQYNCGS